MPRFVIRKLVIPAVVLGGALSGCGANSTTTTASSAGSAAAPSTAGPTTIAGQGSPTGDERKELADASRYFHHEPTEAELDGATVSTIRGRSPGELRSAYDLGFGSAKDDQLKADMTVMTLRLQNGVFQPPRSPYVPAGGEGPKLDGDTLVLIAAPSMNFQNSSVVPWASAQKLLALAN